VRDAEKAKANSRNYYWRHRESRLATSKSNYYKTKAATRERMINASRAYRAMMKHVNQLVKDGMFMLIPKIPRGDVSQIVLNACNPERCDNEIVVCEYDLCHKREYICVLCGDSGTGDKMFFHSNTADIFCGKCAH
jgi:hypothetical protein